LGFITVGTLDDRFSFHPRQKFLVLLTLSALAAWPWFLVFKAAGVPWLPQTWTNSPLVLPGMAILLSFWFMAVPNAVNIEDAINGYMGGFTLIVLGALALRGVDSRLTMGALLGFLLLNWPRAKHFMGDAGSFGCGFFIAESILRGGGLAHPILALALTAPISMDVTMGLIRRKWLGMSPFTADRATFPHHLLARFKGSHSKATAVLWINVALCVSLSSWPWIAGLYLLGYAAALFLLNSHLLFPTKNTPTPDTNPTKS
jgi:UDP-GlcNAc:undecaprenyl-phosphate GlcNAc-1-phosphate transferase